MPSPLFDMFVRRLSRQLDVGKETFAPLGRLDATERNVERGALLYGEGDPEEDLFVVREGWLFAYAMLAEGARYIHRLYLPGDIVGMEDTNWNYATSSVAALTPCRLGAFAKYDQAGIFRSNTGLGAALYGMAMNDQVVMMDAAKANARLKGPGRVGHFLLATQARHQLTAGDPQGDRFELPMSQGDIADALGLSLVHTNKSLGSLRERGLAEVTRSHCRILNRPALAAMTGFSNRYVVTQRRWRELLRA